MATNVPQHPSPYSFVSYPAEYAFSQSTYPPIPVDISGMQHSGGPYSPHPHYATNIAFAHLGHPPPSPIVTHAHLPPSPIIHGSNHTQTPPSPDRYSPETKVMRQLCTAITKMQNTMKDLAERQEQILDRMSLLEQRVGRADDGIERILENTEIAMEDSKSIRTRAEDSESQDALEMRLTDLMDQMIEKLIGGIGTEIKDIKRMVKETDRYTKHNPYELARRITDADLLGQEEQKELPEI